MKTFHLQLLLSLLWIAPFDLSAQGLGNGSDGSPSISGTINIYTSVSNIAVNGCHTAITVSSAIGFQANDLVVLMQMQGAVIDTTNTANYGTVQNLNSTGNFEFCKVANVVGNVININAALINSYNYTNGKVQLINVPQYTNPIVSATLTCTPWNGTTGGVLVLDATGTVTLNANIDLSANGFRGGTVQNGNTYTTHLPDFRAMYNPTYYTYKGEGIAGYGFGLFICGRGAPANGGGGGNVVNAGGAGGANFGCGGLGGQGFNAPTYSGVSLQSQGIGGHALSYSAANLKLYLGGGGGAAHENDAQAYDAGNGGGIIIINANTIIGNNNSINSNGQDVSTPSGIDGGSGGGAGGAILCHVSAYSGNLTITANGGYGENTPVNSGYYHGPGGGGGGGAVIFNAASTPAGVTVSVLGGLQGLCGGNNSFETDGCAGGIVYNYAYPPINNASATNASFNYTICAGHPYTTPSGKIITVVNSTIITDTITNVAGCDSVITIHLFANDSSLKIIHAHICQGNSYTMPDGSVVYNSGLYPYYYSNYVGCDSTILVYLSQTQTTTSNHTINACDGDTLHLPGGVIATTSGNYFSTITSYLGCDSIIQTVAEFAKKYQFTLGADTTICIGKSIVLNANPTNRLGGNYIWNNGMTTPAVEVTSAGLYIATVGFSPCPAAKDSIRVKQYDCSCKVYMPNAFSPNNDNLNEVIKPIFDCNPMPIDYTFKIYNRWGQQVFATNKTEDSWDGKFKNVDQPIGVFDYEITYRADANTDKVLMKGDITLVR